jgi:hypothetical protein
MDKLLAAVCIALILFAVCGLAVGLVALGRSLNIVVYLWYKYRQKLPISTLVAEAYIPERVQMGTVPMGFFGGGIFVCGLAAMFFSLLTADTMEQMPRLCSVGLLMSGIPAGAVILVVLWRGLFGRDLGTRGEERKFNLEKRDRALLQTERNITTAFENAASSTETLTTLRHLWRANCGVDRLRIQKKNRTEIDQEILRRVDADLGSVVERVLEDSRLAKLTKKLTRRASSMLKKIPVAEQFTTKATE